MTDYSEFEADLDDFSRHKFGGLPKPLKQAPIILGICAMKKKAESKAMKEILNRLRRLNITVVIFPEKAILNDPVESWPSCHCLISFFSDGFPLEKAVAYAELRKPFLINEIKPQFLLKDRRHVMNKYGVPTPPQVVMNRSASSPSGYPVIVNQEDDLQEYDDYIVVSGVRIDKPFVEKPVDGDDHNIYIYYPRTAGGGSCRLFRKVDDRSSEFFPDANNVRRNGSYIYESFIRTEGSDVKVYTVSETYAHSEARKSPTIDGVVSRNDDGFEVRYPVLLNPVEKEIAARIVVATGQRVCGFDVLRSDSNSYVCDVNGWSFVKNNQKYYDDFALILSDLMRRAMGIMSLQRFFPAGSALPEGFEEDTDDTDTDNGPSTPQHAPSFRSMNIVDDNPHEELRCVIAIVRHGDRTPKQKLKLKTSHPSLLSLFSKYGTGKVREELKLKSAAQLSSVLKILCERIKEVERERSQGEESDGEEQDYLDSLLQARTVLEMHGTFKGINRKVQLKPIEWDEDTGAITTAQFILKWGGVLTFPGRHQAEQMGQSFRQKLYPFDGLLRLHSTYRHDLKVYSSNEGRVQVTAAAFAKGLLSFTGHLTPILTSLVRKSPDVDQLLDDASDAKLPIEQVKQRLHAALLEKEPVKETLMETVAPTDASSLTDSFAQIDYNPRAAMGYLNQHIVGLVKQLRVIVKTHRAKFGINLGSAGVANTGKLLEETQNSDRSAEGGAKMSGESNESVTSSLDRSDVGHSLQSIVSAENGTALLMALHRWSKLEKDFYVRKKDRFDLSKIPDIADSVKFDMLHNPQLLKLEPPHLRHIFQLSLSLADIVVPQEYGITPKEKKSIGGRIARNLIEKIRSDFANTVTYCINGQVGTTAASSTLPTPVGGSVRTFQKVEPLSAGPTPLPALSAVNNGSNAANTGAGATVSPPETPPDNGVESLESSSVASEETFHRLDRRHARSMGIKSSDRMVRTRLYFTSESHLHSLLNVLRYTTPESLGLNEDDEIDLPELSEEAKRQVEAIPELNYLTHIVFRLFEVSHRDSRGRSFRRRRSEAQSIGSAAEADAQYPRRFRVSVAVSPGVEISIGPDGKIEQGCGGSMEDMSFDAQDGSAYGSEADIQLLPCSPLVPLWNNMEYNKLDNLFSCVVKDVNDELAQENGATRSGPSESQTDAELAEEAAAMSLSSMASPRPTPLPPQQL
eukprot:CAMPEP_0171485940 /NCGR_PEP_ID=MMETSP0958-20121227/816_1 /TAXON_ID=87120 /ORGANISM="Aurantiochytrium limacinum, Strain ATCCMYA-1381" /LENGTH=1196 /DNA_ID=CAMNT_0012018769 /DNA_START=126 /DNA_END=3717 /DNA_ORIENTATION=-